MLTDKDDHHGRLCASKRENQGHGPIPHFFLKSLFLHINPPTHNRQLGPTQLKKLQNKKSSAPLAARTEMVTTQG